MWRIELVAEEAVRTRAPRLTAYVISDYGDGHAVKSSLYAPNTVTSWLGEKATWTYVTSFAVVNKSRDISFILGSVRTSISPSQSSEGGYLRLVTSLSPLQ